jgi:hypothetical protein
MKTLTVVTIAVAVLSAVALAQEPPGWVPLGNIPDATKVLDVLEIPGSNTLVACGWGNFPSQPMISRSTNAGQNWSVVLNEWPYGTPVLQLGRDAVSGRIWAVTGRSAENTLYYSTNDGQNWDSLSGPSQDPAVTGNCIEVVGDYLYFGGTINSPYSISLYRLHQTNLTWDLVSTYPECDAVTQLKFHDGKLFVFCRDKDEAKVRVFTYTPSELDARAIYVGKAETSTPSSGR